MVSIHFLIMMNLHLNSIFEFFSSNPIFSLSMPDFPMLEHVSSILLSADSNQLHNIYVPDCYFFLNVLADNFPGHNQFGLF